MFVSKSINSVLIWIKRITSCPLILMLVVWGSYYLASVSHVLWRRGGFLISHVMYLGRQAFCCFGVFVEKQLIANPKRKKSKYLSYCDKNYGGIKNVRCYSVSGSFTFWESHVFEKGLFCSLPSTLKRHSEVIRKLIKVETQVFVLH